MIKYVALWFDVQLQLAKIEKKDKTKFEKSWKKNKEHLERGEYFDYFIVIKFV